MTSDPNSALNWFPRIRDADLPVPKTILLPYDHVAAIGGLEGGDPSELNRLCEAAAYDVAVEDLYPCFIRTDLACAKHSGPSAYLAEAPKRIREVIAETIVDSEMKLWPHARPAAIMLREFLELDSAFCAFGGLPIAREWRFFADGERCICYHPYWPPDSLQFFGATEPDGWQEMLAKQSERPAWHVWRELEAMAIEAAKACGGGAWSVDFAPDRNGKWYLLDMATMADSWHWPECLNASKESEREIDWSALSGEGDVLKFADEEDPGDTLMYNHDEGVETRG